MDTELPPILISSAEYARLVEIAKGGLRPRRSPPVADYLLRELARAQVLPPDAMPTDVIRMNSTFDCRDAAHPSVYRFTLTYPGEEHFFLSGISVLSPIGAAAIGLKVGQSIPWQTATGEQRSLRVLRLTEGEGQSWLAEADPARSHRPEPV